MKRLRCLHCNKKPISRPRGLCWTCYYNEEIRKLYPTSMNPGANRSLVGLQGKKKPCQPTKARRGTEEKIKVLAERAEAGQELFHELDP